MPPEPEQLSDRRGIDRAFGPSLCPDCGAEHGTNAPDCAECRHEAEAQRETAERREIEAPLRAEVERLREALEHVIESCEHTSPTIHAYDYIAHSARQALSPASDEGEV